MYSDLSQVIVSVGLVKPRHGVFAKKIKVRAVLALHSLTNDVQHVLVLATPVDIVLVGLRFENDRINGAITLYSSSISFS